MKKLLIVLALALISAEVFLRHCGFCDAVLYRPDPSFEYIANPNQHRFRYGNHIRYNAYSMRSEEVDTTAYLILGFGDSILNGGQQTDNADLATTILSDSLTSIYKRKFQFLNIAEKSWGPDNTFAYLNKYGHFGARKIYLFVSSHDAHDTMTFQKLVGNKDYPDKQYPLALLELIDRYLLPKENRTANEPNGLNEGFVSFLLYSKQYHLPLTIYLHAEAAELQAGTYNTHGQEIIDFATHNHIPLLRDLETLSSSDYTDYIHLNANGQKKIAEVVLTHYQ